MAKVLFVVYVPSTDEETDDDDKHKNAVEEDDIIQGKDAEIDGKDKENGNMTEENNTDSITKLTNEQQEDKEVTELLKEDKSDERAEDESRDYGFFKDIKKEDSVESTAKAGMDSESSVTEETNNESEKEPESKKPTFVRFLSEKLTLIKKVKRVLEDLNLKGAQWNKTDQNVFIGMFVADDGAQCEEILRKLSMLQIGVIKDSSVSVFPASISSEEKWIEEEIQQEMEKADELSEKVTRFKNSIKSRLVVDQVVNAVKNDAKFTFDYLMLVILASLVAIMGLLESSSVVLVASMLISPLMGPILAGVFGVVIRKGDLIRVGIVNEIRGLTICVFIGFVIGFIPACLEVGSSRWRSSSEWPTPEMSSRGALRALPVGILIAIPSGAGVALSILGGKVGSLVGVAISASLLPPAVNAGLLWANAIVAAISPPPVVKYEVNASYLELNQTSGHGLSCASLANNDYERYYFCSMASESVILGLISLLLTILNIICIILMGVIVLKIKEVAPIPQSIIPESETEFFCQDLKIARESNVTMKGQAAAVIRKEWLKSYKEMKSQAGNQGNEDEEDENELDDIINEVEDSPSVMSIYDKMHIHPTKWSKHMKVPFSKSGIGKTFDFPTPSPSPREGTLSDMELRRRSPSSPESFNTCEEEQERENAVYYTVHKYIPSRDLVRGDSFSFKSGKFLKKLILPKTSRFMVARVVEEPEDVDTAVKVEEKTSLVTVSETEAQPLLNSETSDVV